MCKSYKLQEIYFRNAYLWTRNEIHWSFFSKVFAATRAAHSYLTITLQKVPIWYANGWNTWKKQQLKLEGRFQDRKQELRDGLSLVASCDVNHKAISNIIFCHPVHCLVNSIRCDHLNITGDVMLRADIYHLLSLFHSSCHASLHRSFPYSSIYRLISRLSLGDFITPEKLIHFFVILTENQRKRRKLHGLVRCAHKHQCSLHFKQVQDRTQGMRCRDCVNNVVEGPRPFLTVPCTQKFSNISCFSSFTY